MADSVKRVKIQATADLRGLEDAAKALKDLQRAIAPTDSALEQVRKEILEFAAVNKRSEAAIQAQLAAFQKLRQQAEMGGRVYNDLGRDIEKLKRVAAESTGTLSKFGQAVSNAGRSSSGKPFWQQQAQELAAFNRQAGETGKALGQLAGSFGARFEKTSQALQEASRQISLLKQNASSIGTLAQGPAAGGGVFEFGRKGMRDIGAFANLVKGLKEQSESATGKVARLSEGMFALGATGVAVNQVTTALGGVAGAAERVSSFGANLAATFAQMGASAPAWSGGMKTALNQVALLLNQPANGIANWTQSLSGVQSKLTMLNAPLEAFANGLAAIGPEGAAAAGVMAVAFAGLQDGITRAFRAGEKEASEALQGITNETQQLLQKLAQLSEAFRSAASMRELQALRAGAQARFNETPAGTDASRRAANSIASAEARIKAEGAAQAAVLEEARKKYRGTSESVDALSERLAYLTSAMKLVDQSTTEGKAEFAAFSSEAARVKKQIDSLSQSYRTVADAIRDAAAAQGQYANQSTTANYFNRAAARRQEEIAQAAREALARPQTPLLPAAGRTSFAGEYGPGGLGGGARMGTGAKEFANILGTEQLGQGITAIYRGLERTQMEADATAAALERGFNKAGAAINAAERQVDELQRELNQALAAGARAAEALTKLDFVNPNSINALKSRREEIDKQRNSVDMLSKEYRELSRELAKVDGRIERTQVGGLRGKVGYIGQGIGAAASAGIFGGPEGLLGGLGGGLIGAALGGPAGFAAGAFTGSSIGAYAGMGRQQLGGMTTYAADISKLEIALKGTTKTQEEYSRALAASAAVTRDFNVPQLEATKGITQLSAAVIGAGGKVADAEVVFRNVTAAIKASGGSAEDVQGAMTALAQIFSKGKVSAEELQGQLGERLPGAVTMFAKATGRTLPQLQKDLEQGVVGLADLMKFVVSDQGLGQFEQGAKAVAKSSADAGARLTTTWNDTRRAIGAALLPLGAQIQDSLANALRDATPALVGFAKTFGNAVKIMADNAGLIAGVLKTLLGFAAVAGAAIGVTQLAAAVTTVTAAVASLGGVMGVTTLAANGLGLAIAAIPGIGWVAAGVTALGLLSVELYNNNTAFKNWVDNIGGVVAGDFKSAMDEMKSYASSAFKFIGDLLPKYEAQSAKSQADVSDGWGSAFKSVRDKADRFIRDIAKSFDGLWNDLPPWARNLLLNNLSGIGAGPTVGVTKYILGASGRAAQGTAQSTGMYGRYAAPEVQRQFKTDREDSGLTDWKIEQKQKEAAAKQAADTALREAERLAAEQQRLDEQLARNGIQLDDERFRHRQELIRREFEYQQELAQRQNELWANNFVGLGAQSARAVADLFAKLDSYRKAQFDSQAGIAAAQQGLRSSRALEGVTSQGLPGGGVGQLGKLSSQGQALVAAARKLGVSPLDLATIIGFETGGTYSPSKWGGAGGNYMGLIQFGPNERKAYGANSGQSFEEQVMGPVVRYFQDRFKSVGMSTQGADLLTLYRTVLGGNPKASLGARDAFGTSPQSGVAQMAPHRAEALRRFFGGSMANVPSGAAGVAGQVRRDVSAEGQVAISQAQLLQQQKLAEFEKKRIDALKSFDYAQFNQDLTRGLLEQNQALQQNVDDFKLKARLEAEGMRPELVEAEMTKARLYREQQQLLEPLKEALAVVDDPETKAQIVNAMSNINSLYTDQIDLVEQLAQAQTASGAKLAAYVGQLRLQLSELSNVENMVISMSQTIESEISGAMSTAINSVISGTGSVKQAMADMFRNIGASFIQMATQIIAKQIVMIALQSILKALGGAGAFGGGGGNAATAMATNPNVAAYAPLPTFANGGVMTNVGPLPLKRYATGGVAKSPQMAVFGERGPEAYVPLPDGRSIPVKMKQRTEALNRYKPMSGMGTMAGDGAESAGGGLAVAGTSAIDVRYSVERINNVDYVTAEQFQQGMQQAAAQGAAQGERRTLRRLQQSPTTRRKLGV